MKLISEKNIENISLGAGFLGSGGGGNPYLGKLLAIEAVKKYGPVKMLQIEDFSEDDLIITACGMGAPSVSLEKLHNLEEHLIPTKTLEKHLGKKAKAIISAEVGGFNSMMPLIVSAGLGIPLIDGDAMGRAFPELQMVTYTLGNIPAVPMALADEKGNSVIISQSRDNHNTEKIARSISRSMGARASIALYPSNSGRLKKYIIRNTMTLAEKIGSIIKLPENVKNRVDKLCSLTGGIQLFEGKVEILLNSIEKGFNRGSVTITNCSDGELKVDFQNEFLAAFLNGKPLITTPDLIVLLDQETLEPLTTDSLKYGLRVFVMGVPCDSQWRSAEGLKLVGPCYFGYDTEYIPVEKRASNSSL